MEIREKLYLLFTTNLCKHDTSVLQQSSNRMLVHTTEEKLNIRILITFMDAIKYRCHNLLVLNSLEH